MQEEGKMLEELRAGYKAADRVLNTTYNRLAAEMDSAARAKLLKAQRAWMAFRDANTVLHADYLRGGAASEIMLFTTLAEMTKARTRELDAIRAERNAARKH